MRYIFLSIICVAFFSCQESSNDPQVISTPGKKAHGQYLIKDNNGNIVLSWLEKEGEKNVMYFAISSDGQSFGKPVKIPVTLGTDAAHGECPPKLIVKQDGSLFVVYALKKPSENNQWAGNVYYSISKDKGVNWSAPKPLDSDTNPDLSRSFFDIANLGNGELGAIWLKGKSHKDTTNRGSSIHFASSENEGFGAPIKIQDNTCECCRTDLFVDKSKALHVTYRAVSPEQKRDMVHCISTNNGMTFSEPTQISNDNWVINGCPHVGPDVAEVKGQLHYVWYTKGGKGGIYSCSSSDKGKTFSGRKFVIDSEKASHPQITTTTNGKIVYVWDENFKEGDKFIQKIGIRIDGPEPVLKYIISAEHLSHPLVSVIDENNILIAYSKKEKNKEQVLYQRINLKNL